MNFDVESNVTNIIDFIRDYFKKHNLGGVILGISGGKDSAVVAALFVKALGGENVLGVTMPCYSKDEDIIDAKLLSEYYGFKLINFDITNVFDSFKNELNNLGDFSLENVMNSDINLKPRLRMSTLYYLAALYSSLRNKTYIVAGTSNKCELAVGYFTKGGDSVHDISVLADFTVDEVIKIGEYLKVPETILYKVPNDGLSNLTDEDKLGVTYKDIAKYLNDDNTLDDGVRVKIDKLYNNSRHKFNIPTFRRDNYEK